MEPGPIDGLIFLVCGDTGQGVFAFLDPLGCFRILIRCALLDGCVWCECECVVVPIKPCPQEKKKETSICSV